MGAKPTEDRIMKRTHAGRRNKGRLHRSCTTLYCAVQYMHVQYVQYSTVHACTVQCVQYSPELCLLLRYCVQSSPVRSTSTYYISKYWYLQYSPCSCRIASFLDDNRATPDAHDDKVPGRTSIGQPIRGPGHPEPAPIPPCFHLQKRF